MNYAPILLASALTTLTIASSPDPLAPRPNGMRAAAPSLHLITDATIHTAPGQTIEHADILINNGIIVAVGPDLEPGSATVWNIDGAHIYAGFIDPYIEVDAPMPPANAVGSHWSSKITPQRDALDIGLPADSAESLRAMGFTTAMIAPESGIFRGWSAVVSTAEDFSDDSMGDPPTYQAHTAMMMGFDRGTWPDRAYPTSHMGVVALMRQTFIDAKHRSLTDHTDTSCLDEIDPQNTTLFYETNHELEALLADKIATEFDHANLVIIDNGSAHRRLNAFAEMGYPMIVPLRFPKTPDVFTVGDADSVSLAALQHHERAPANARWLANSRINVSLTTSKGNDHDNFWDNLHTAIEKGLEPNTALAMITTNPANLLGLENQGSIKANNIANLVIASGDLFDPSSDAQIIDTWVDGRRHHINDESNTRFDGDWIIELVGIPFQLNMAIDGNTIEITTGSGDDATEDKARKVNIDHNQISFITNDPNNDTTVITGTLSPDGIIRGSGLNPAQQSFQWTATKNTAKSIENFSGNWSVSLGEEYVFTLDVSTDNVTLSKTTDNGENISQEASSARVNYSELVIEFDYTQFGLQGKANLVLFDSDDNKLMGSGNFPSPDGRSMQAVSAIKISPVVEHTNLLPDLPTTPFGPFAYDKIPSQGTYLITGATIWTQGEQGVIENGVIEIRDGKIIRVRKSGVMSAKLGPDSLISARGMHITPGLIDAHSHTGLFRFGVNESGQAVTAEVRIADSLDP
ncbi:MAG: amidohydrolase family protein, partial [Phycisphaerales bacterium]|nr:amidohydrolase family protein [Phycisphaerales bacterium]